MAGLAATGQRDSRSHQQVSGVATCAPLAAHGPPQKDVVEKAYAQVAGASGTQEETSASRAVERDGCGAILTTPLEAVEARVNGEAHLRRFARGERLGLASWFLGPGQGRTAVSMSREPAYQRMSDIDMTIIGPVTKGKGPSQLPGGVRQARSPRGVSRGAAQGRCLAREH